MKTQRRTFLKQVGVGVAGLGVCGSIPAGFAAVADDPVRLPRSTPEAQGVSSAGILAFLDAVEHSQHEFHSFMMLRHGRVIAEGWWKPYRPEANHMLYSLSKSFTSTAVGFAVAEGKLKVDDAVVRFFPGEVPATVGKHLASLRVRDLLTMSAGHAKETGPLIQSEQNWVKTFLAQPIENAPGSVFHYDSGLSYMLSAIVQQVTGQKILDYLRPRFFDPLGVSDMTWETCPVGINTGGWGLSVQTGCLAKFGQFYLQKGFWNGRQILPAAWIEEATSFHIQQPAGVGQNLEQLKRTDDWHQGYAYQFWLCRHDAYRGDGAMGQKTVIMPRQDAVIAMTSETANMQGELDLVWRFLLPAFKDNPLPADDNMQTKLDKRLALLILPPPQSRTASPLAKGITGKTFKLEENGEGLQTVSFFFQDGRCAFTLTDVRNNYPVDCGLDRWVDGTTNLPGTPPRRTPAPLGPEAKIAAAGAWQDEKTFEMTWRFFETPHHDTVTCRFDGDQVRIEFVDSISQKSPAGPKPHRALRGRLAS